MRCKRRCGLSDMPGSHPENSAKINARATSVRGSKRCGNYRGCLGHLANLPRQNQGPLCFVKYVLRWIGWYFAYSFGSHTRSNLASLETRCLLKRATQLVPRRRTEMLLRRKNDGLLAESGDEFPGAAIDCIRRRTCPRRFSARTFTSI